MKGQNAMHDTIEQEIEQPVAGGKMPFHYLVSIIQSGDLNARLTEALADIGGALNQYFQDYRGTPTAEISLKLKFKLEKGVVSVTAEPTVKMPKAPAAGETLWIDRNNNFSRDNPNQLTMGFDRRPRPVS